MSPLLRPAALLRRAFTVLPWFAALASAHPGGHGRPLPPRSCLEAARLDFGKVAVGMKAESSLTVRNRCPQAFSVWKVSAGSKAFSSSLPAPVRIPGRGAGSIPVAFAPSDTGAKSAVLVLYARHPEQWVYARVSGIGSAPPPPPPAAGISVSPSSVRLALGPAETDTFRLAVTNHGTSPRAEILVDALGDPAPRPDRGWRVLYLNTMMNGTWDDALIAQLRPLANVDTLAAWYGADSLPSLSRMLEYDIVMLLPVRAWKDSAVLMDRLADFVEAGGKLLLTAGCLAEGGHSLFGRIQQYAPVGAAQPTYGRTSQTLANHPITAGVGAFHSGGIIQVTSTPGQGAGIPLGTYEDGILIGAYHPDKPVVFLNIGNTELSGDIPRLVGNAFDYLGGMLAWMTPKPPVDPVIFVVPDGETKELKVAVHTHRLGAGNHAGYVRLLNASDTAAAAIDVPVSLAVASRRRLALDPAAVDLGPTWQGGRATRTVRLVNAGNAPTRVTGFASDGAAFSLTAPLPLDIPAFSYAYAQASFAPAGLGPDSASVLARSDAQETEPPVLKLSGKGIAAPVLSVAPRGFDVTLAEGQRTEQALTIRNPGGDSLKLTLRATVDSAAGTHPTGPAKMKVLYLETTNQSYESPSDFFLWDLLGDPRIDTVIAFSGKDSTPALEYLRRFDAVVVASATAWADSETVGDRLADYVDAGGKVILMDAALYGLEWVDPHSPGLGGRIVSPEYAPVAAARGIASNYAVEFADDPIMEGITNALSTDWAMNVTATQGGGIPLGRYSTGALIGAYNPRKPVVFLNVYPLDGYNYPPQTVRLIGNALEYLSGFYDWLRPARRSLALGPGEEAEVPIRFGADYGLPAGTYAGRLDLYHNAPATGNPLALPATLTVTPGSETAATRP